MLRVLNSNELQAVSGGARASRIPGHEQRGGGNPGGRGEGDPDLSGGPRFGDPAASPPPVGPEEGGDRS